MALATLTPEWDVDDDEFTGDEFDTTWDFPKIVLSKPSPKLDAVMNLITTNEEEPFVVFTQFRGMADLVEEECQRLKIPVSKITGEVLSKDIRTQRVADFQEGRTRVFVGTIAAAGKTITLTRANHVIFIDRSWRPAQNEQAEDRLWRRTQKNTVRVYDIQAEDSIDQIRMDRINQKAKLLESLYNPRSS
jgi:SNF2 family DNA or RNA helicase